MCFSQQTCVCHDKTCLLSWQKYAWSYKTSVVTKLCLSWQMFYHDRYLSQQTHVSCDKSFVSTSILLLRQKTCFVMTNPCLSWQKCACQNKTFVATKLCLSQQIFVVTNILLWQKYFVMTNSFSQQNFCHNKHNFVTTKDVFCRNKHLFVVTKLLSWQKWYLWQLLLILVSRCGLSQRCSFMRCSAVLLLLCPAFLDNLEIKKGVMFVDGKSLIKQVFNEALLIGDFHWV